MISKTPPLEKTQGNPSLQESIRLALEEELGSGKLRPGDAIDESALCQRFGSSRTPVREALLLLVAKGLIEIVPRSGIYVKQLDARELVAMLEGLAELEGVLARLAASRLNHHLREKLQQALAQTQACANTNDAEGYVKANALLHELIYEASGNDYVVEQTRLLRLRMAPYRSHIFEKPGRLARSQAEHESLIAAICAGQTEVAAETMRQHICAGGSAFTDLVLSAGYERPRKSSAV